jgi:hypothetical protein
MGTSEWVDTPRLYDVVVEHGKGKSVVTGGVYIAFTSATSAHVATDGDRNYHNGLMFRCKEWSASAHVSQNEAGDWVVTDRSDYLISERGSYGKYAAPSYRDAINAALIATVAEHWTPELAREAEYARAMRALYRERQELEKTRDAYDTACANVKALEAIANANAPKVKP